MNLDQQKQSINISFQSGNDESWTIDNFMISGDHLILVNKEVGGTDEAPLINTFHKIYNLVEVKGFTTSRNTVKYNLDGKE